jgi:hypothetical protein
MQRSHRESERGGVLVIALVVLTALSGLGALTILAVQGVLSSASNERFRASALYAAESGLAAGKAYLQATTDWSALVEPNNDAPQAPSDLHGNGVAIGATGNPLSSAWYRVVVLNNSDDPGFAAGDDDDSRVILRSEGHGPNGSLVILEAEVGPTGVSMGGPCSSYAQKNMTEAGSGFNPCLGQILDSAQVVSASPDAL